MASVDLLTNTIASKVDTIKVERRAAEILHVLAENEGKMIPRDEVVKRIWGGKKGIGGKDHNGKYYNGLHVQLHNVRYGIRRYRGIRSIGLDIEAIFGRGLRLVEMTAAE